MQPAQYDIQVYRGDYFELTLRLRGGELVGEGYVPGDYMDLTGWTPKAEIRTNEDASTPLASFTCQLLDQTQTGSVGGVYLFLPSAQSALLQVPTAVWDIQIADDSTPPRVFTYLRGKVTVTKDVTR